MEFENFEIVQFAKITHSKKALLKTGKYLFREFFINLCIVALKEKEAYGYADNTYFLKSMGQEALKLLEKITVSTKTTFSVDNVRFDVYSDDKQNLLEQYTEQILDVDEKSIFGKMWHKADKAVTKFLSWMPVQCIYIDISLKTVTLRDAVIMMLYSGELSYISRVSEYVRVLLAEAELDGNYKYIRDDIISMLCSGESYYISKTPEAIREIMVQSELRGDGKKINLLGEEMLLRIFDIFYPYFMREIDTTGIEQDDFLQELRIRCLEIVRCS